MAKSETMTAPAAGSVKATSDKHFASDPLNWIRAHRKPLTAGAIILLAIAGGVWLTLTTQQRKEVAGQAALTEARSAFDSYNLPAAAAAFQEIIQGFSGTRAAKEATLALNQVRMINGQNELAIVSLRDFISKSPVPAYQVPASALMGAALENVNRPAEAAAAYLRASTLAEVDYLKADYLLAAGRAFDEAGKTAEAEQAFTTIIDEFPETPSLTEAKVRLSELDGGQYSDAPEPI